MTSNNEANEDIVVRATNMAERAKEGSPFTEEELNGIEKSIRNLQPDEKNENDGGANTTTGVDHAALRELLSQVAHLSHKDWSRTGDNSIKLGNILMPNGMKDDAIRQMLERIIKEGNWDAAATHGQNINTNNNNNKSWAVLVTGVNGIRKTTSIYQEWFPKLLSEALISPPNAPTTEFDLSSLPCGTNSFFRQLDHMIATLCNQDFAQLYQLTQNELEKAENNNDQEPTQDIIQKYSNLKASIFSRYRTLSELLGVLLLREAQKLSSNCLMETSGKDVAMFHYINQFFPNDEKYNKLALHFTINDLTHAQKSVDSRMVREIKVGIEALKETKTDDQSSSSSSSSVARQVVYANAGGPYGSEVLPGVQEASDRVWNEMVLNQDEEVGNDWYKATIAITAHETEPWTARAVKADGSLGTVYTFSKPPTLSN